VTQGKFLSEATFYINTTPQESFGALIKGLLFLNLIGNSFANILLKEMTMIKVTRFGVSMDTNLLRRFDEHIKKRGYSNRSEAFRDLVRDRLVKEEWAWEEEETVGTVTLIYDHHQRELQEQLTEQQHRYLDKIVSSMHVHLDENNCLEVLAVKGKARDVKDVAHQLISRKGVKHGKLVMTTTGKNL